MNRQLSVREIRMVMLPPAVLVVGIYAYAFDRPWRMQIDTLHSAAARALANPVPPSAMQDAKAEIAQLTAQIDSEKHRAAAGTPSSLVLPARWTNAAGRLSALADISSILAANSAFVINTFHLADTAVSTVAPPSLHEFAAAANHELQSEIPQVWRIDLVGSYADVAKSLDDLEKRDEFIVPLGITMETIDDQTSYRKWSLWVWV